jgi:autotransporter-associated beta strand protein
MFLNGTTNTSFDVSAGVTETISTADAIAGDGGFTKTGAGALMLESSDSYTGGTILQAGTLDLAAVSAAGTGAITFSGPAELKIASAALSSNDFASVVHRFASGDTIDLPSLPFVPGASAIHNSPLHTLSVTSGATTITFDDVETTRTGLRFAVLDDRAGGSRVMLATIATANHELVDAKHHPPGQPPLTNGSNLIVAEGANEVIKPPGGNNTEVARGRGDVLVSSDPSDNFVFESLKVSPPSHPDEIIGFKHPLHDLIDLYDFHLAVPGDQPLVGSHRDPNDRRAASASAVPSTSEHWHAGRLPQQAPSASNRRPRERSEEPAISGWSGYRHEVVADTLKTVPRQQAAQARNACVRDADTIRSAAGAAKMAPRPLPCNSEPARPAVQPCRTVRN